MEPTTEDLFRFGVALAIGAMIGIERQFSGTRDDADLVGSPPSPAPPPGERLASIAAAERPSSPPQAARTPSPPPAAVAPAGVRTFALISLTGGAAAYLAPTFPWLFPAALLVVGALVLAGYLRGARAQDDVGLTSEVSSVVTFLLGAMAVSGETTLAGACAVAVAGLLALKRALHAFTWKLEQTDILAALKLAVITVVILPMLPADPIALGELLERRRAATAARTAADPAQPADPPEAAAGEAPPASAQAPAPDEPAPRDVVAPGERAPQAAGPRAAAPRPWYHDVSISPRKVWYLVVLISGVSFAGYVLVKVLGAGRGLLLTGVLGGVASSTAVSLSFSQRSRESPDLSPRLALGILIANAIMPLRLLLIVAALQPRVALRLALPLLAMLATGGLYALVLRLRGREPSGAVEVPPLKNPFEITPALKLGAVFALVLLLAQVAQALFGAAGTYVLAFVSGLTDVDAIGLALSAQVGAGGLPVTTAAVGIAIAAVSNTLIKGVFVVWFGAPGLRRIALVAFGLMAAAGAGGIVGLHAL